MPLVINLDIFGEGMCTPVTRASVVVVGFGWSVCVRVDIFGRPGVCPGEWDATVARLEAAGWVVICPALLWKEMI